MICQTCFRHCDIPEGKTGYCRGRKNENGVIVPANYGQLTSLALDPIEKKPLGWFYPGSNILSAGSYGCNLSCPFCQNHSISHPVRDIETLYVPPEDLVAKAVELKPYNNIGIAFTYNEPMISWEYIRDTFRLAKEAGLKTVIVTSGSTSPESLDEVLDLTDAFNIDLKGFTQDYYDYVGGDLEAVKAFIKKAAAKSHVELTTLVIPGKNDSVEDMEAMAKWIADISPDIPLHLTRYFPRWKSTAEATPIDTLETLKAAADKHLNHVRLGNV